MRPRSKIPELPTLAPIELDGYSLDIGYFLKREYEDIGKAAVELPAIIEWVNVQLQVFVEQKHRLKASLDRAEAQAYISLKNGGFQRAGYGEKATEDAVGHAIHLDEHVITVNEELAVMTGWVERLFSLQKSLQSKLELVRSYESTRRHVSEEA